MTTHPTHATGTAAGDRRRRFHGAFSWRGYALVFGAATVAAAAVIALGVWAGARSGGEPSRPSVIQYVLPPEGGAMMRQDAVGVTLEQGYGCILVIDGIRIPEGQYTGVGELGECHFQAGPETMIEEFAPGRHTASATVFPIGRPNETQSYSWSFQTQ